MIGKITGRVDYRGADHVLVDVNGVGYLVYCSERTLAGLPPRGGVVALYTDLLVREDNLQLFGFPTLAEREWHKLLTRVQGIGAKAALAIAGTLGTEGVSRAIALGDVAAIKSAPGVGLKMAQRVVSELQDKAPAIMAMGESGAELAQAQDGAVIDPPPAAAVAVAEKPAEGRSQASAQADALSALVNLGYGQGDAAGAVAQASGDDPAAGASQLIRAALKQLAPKA